ncbi:MAG: SDR family oxidoreductase [Gammaproteobacteria bacterium]|nr:SDR family oxidoreductase [Gammaproteobacteria bacterium]
MLDLNLYGKKALVCGASQGMGKACAIELADMGADIILLSRNEAKLKKTLTSLSTSKKQKHQYICIGLKHTDALKKAIEPYLESDCAIEILINNSGGPQPGKIQAADIQSFQSAFDSHLKASVLLSQLLIPGMKKAQFGRIINIASTSVKTPLENLGVSNTVRWAVAAWAKTLSYEVAQYGITVNTVLPGSIDTDRMKDMIHVTAENENCSDEQARRLIEANIPAGHLGTTKQFADVVAFLASPAANYVNGVALAIDGGRTRAL